MSRAQQHCHDRRVTAEGDRACVFCQVGDGQVDADVVHQDERTVAIMDLRQPGWPDSAHVLVLPREHVEAIDRMSADQVAHTMHSVVRVAGALRRAFRPEGISVWQSNGEAAGQEVQHVHFHVLSRRAGDGLLRIYPSKPTMPSVEDLRPVAERLRSELSSAQHTAKGS